MIPTTEQQRAAQDELGGPVLQLDPAALDAAHQREAEWDAREEANRTADRDFAARATAIQAALSLLGTNSGEEDAAHLVKDAAVIAAFLLNGSVAQGTAQ